MQRKNKTRSEIHKFNYNFQFKNIYMYIFESAYDAFRCMWTSEFNQRLIVYELFKYTKKILYIYHNNWQQKKFPFTYEKKTHWNNNKKEKKKNELWVLCYWTNNKSTNKIEIIKLNFWFSGCILKRLNRNKKQCKNVFPINVVGIPGK